jgi:hypothetical protein
MIADESDMSKETVKEIFVQDLDMRKLAAKLMPQNLMEEQKDRHLALYMNFVEQLQYDKFFDRVITGDETWCYQYDPEAK